MGGSTGSHRSRVLNEIGLRFLGGDFAFYSATRQSKPKPATELQMARIAEHRVVPWRGRLRIRTLPPQGQDSAERATQGFGDFGDDSRDTIPRFARTGPSCKPERSVPPLVNAAIQGHAGDSLDSGMLHIILGSRQYRVTSRAAARG